MGEWDNKFKRLFFKYPGDFTQWLAEAELIEELNPHLPSQDLDADALMRARRQGSDMLIHIECQRRVERTKTAFRMWQYNALATFKYKLPVLSYVIYLKREEQVATSPYEVKIGDEVIHRFSFRSIELYNVPTEELRRRGGIGALPLLSLTRDGARHEVVDEIIHEIQGRVTGEDREDLLGMSLSFASLAFEREDDQFWLVRRFAMLDDILNETPFVKFLEARAKLREQVRASAREDQYEREVALKDVLISVVTARFPEVFRELQEQMEHFKNTELLNQLIVQISVANTVEEARQYIVAASQKEQA